MTAKTIDQLKEEYFQSKSVLGFSNWFTSKYGNAISTRARDYVNESSSMRQAIKRIREIGYAS